MSQIDAYTATLTESRAPKILKKADNYDMKKSRYSKMTTCALAGIEGVPIEIELCLMAGLPAFDLGGNCDSTVKESRDRVRAAISNSFYVFPKGKVLAS